MSIGNPDRTKSHLDLLRRNIEQTDLAYNYKETIPIEIDYLKINVTLLGDPFPATFITLVSEETYEEKLINHFLNAMEIAEEIDSYDRIFKNGGPTHDQSKCYINHIR